MKIIPFEGTTIEYEGNLYQGTEQIHKLVDIVIGKILTKNAKQTTLKKSKKKYKKIEKIGISSSFNI